MITIVSIATLEPVVTFISNLSINGSCQLIMAIVLMIGCVCAVAQSNGPDQQSAAQPVMDEHTVPLPPLPFNDATIQDPSPKYLTGLDSSQFTDLPKTLGPPRSHPAMSVESIAGPAESTAPKNIMNQDPEYAVNVLGILSTDASFSDLPKIRLTQHDSIPILPRSGAAMSVETIAGPAVPTAPDNIENQDPDNTDHVLGPEPFNPDGPRSSKNAPERFGTVPTQPSNVDQPFERGIEASPLSARGRATENATWWKSLVTMSFGDATHEQPVDTNSLVYATLQNSPRIRAVSQNPLIRDLQIIEADAEFDPISFVRSQFEDRYDPVGDALSGVPDGILKDNIWTADIGLRRKLRTGATYELGQRLGFKNSNSSFFTPNDQGTATLSLNVTQPLLRGSGRYYNESQILIAQSASGAAWDTFSSELQDEIEGTVQAYWRLYFDRSSYLQKQRNVERGVNVLAILEGRRDLDSLPSQITRARSAVKSRKTDLANALRDIRDAETEIRRLTADRNWRSNQTTELLPTETPATGRIDIALDQVVLTAIEHRPEIKETMERAKIAGIQRDISENELLPELSLLLGTYVSGLEGDSQLGQAIRKEWADTTPGYSVGVEFELPIRNRAAISRFSQRKLQVAKISAEVDETMLNVIAESQIAWRQVTSAKETLDAAFQAIEAARADLEQNNRRWEMFALIEGDLADGQTPTTMLDQLLDSQERLTAAELVYTQSELDLKTSEVALQRAMGTLLIHQNVTFGKTECDDPPEILIDQNGPAAPDFYSNGPNQSHSKIPNETGANDRLEITRRPSALQIYRAAK